MGTCVCWGTSGLHSTAPFPYLYIYNLRKDISSTVKPFLDDKSLFQLLMMLIMYVDVDNNVDVYVDVDVDVFMEQLNH